MRYRARARARTTHHPQTTVLSPSLSRSFPCSSARLATGISACHMPAHPLNGHLKNVLKELNFILTPLHQLVPLSLFYVMGRFQTGPFASRKRGTRDSASSSGQVTMESNVSRSMTVRKKRYCSHILHASSHWMPV